MKTRSDGWTTIVRWTARAWSLATLALVVAFIAGEGVTASGVGQWIGFAFFPVGILAGMLLAWKKERLGGWITVGSLVAFYLVYRATAGTFPPGWAWLVFAVPGFLFLASSYGSERAAPVTT